ncbi:hypothetical protein [Bradyrhizobium sp. STM 3562]|uniref:hypothetical protein n=1 Tax=Bradyrhizobium sp. STM 3562 TaxID=578924 RepID=UPI00388DEC3F
MEKFQVTHAIKPIVDELWAIANRIEPGSAFRMYEDLFVEFSSGEASAKFCGYAWFMHNLPLSRVDNGRTAVLLKW